MMRVLTRGRPSEIIHSATHAQDAYDLLKAVFYPPSSYPIHYKDFTSVKKSRNQSIQQFVSDILIQADRVEFCSERPTEREILNVFINGLPPHFKREILLKAPHDFKDTVSLAERLVATEIDTSANLNFKRNKSNPSQ
ncbi:hypothetical protein ROZALSC1DRAFT_25582 [Rozella allomycis CSF55]|uniref:Retrotransposon gag domain-containing protein n=1 Tax=Rozella allomycis (strain CSF55) TaxID=988480 RepID=A0A4P9YB41_ROZAC|nr:hypothetical protein ROZALSC1DRAFT_25582 [Rozella allomycis CSF55]